MNSLSIVYIASIETITSPGCNFFYCAELPEFLQAVGSNGLPQHAQFPYARARFSRFGKHYSYVAFGKIHFYTKTATSSERRLLSHVRGEAPYPSGHSLPLLCSASLSALALMHVLSVALLRPVSSILLSFAGDASPSVGLLALRSHLLLNAAALAQGSLPFWDSCVIASILLSIGAGLMPKRSMIIPSHSTTEKKNSDFVRFIDSLLYRKQ